VIGSKTPKKPIRLGMIPFWNLLPLRMELSKQVSQDITVRVGVPSSVNQWLQEGLVDLAPCSSICLVSRDFEMALPLGVSSFGPVKSVYLAFHPEHEPFLERIQFVQPYLKEIFRETLACGSFDCRQIAKTIWHSLNQIPPSSTTPLPSSSFPGLKLHQASAASAGLAKLLYYMWFGKDVYEQNIPRNFSSQKRSIELWIGDEALIQRPNFYKIIDLGALWKDLTGLPFVYAVWQSRGACLNGWRRKILAAGELAETRMKVTPSIYHPMDRLPLDAQGKPISLADYWKLIHYKLSPQDFKGLLIFLCLTRHLQAIPLGESFAVKIMRWQEISQTGNIPIL
jgi:predicted solute-binding protein